MKLNFIKIEKLDFIIALIGALLSIILIIYLNFKVARFIYLLVGVLSFISFSLWLFIRKDALIYSHTLDFTLLPKMLLSLFFVFITIDILLLYTRPDIYQRPTLHFLLVALTAGIIFLEIIVSNEDNRIYSFAILFQIVLLGLQISWSQLIVFPSLLGVDPWYHQNFTSLILSSNHLPLNELYSKIPLFHTFTSQVILLTQLNYKYATMFSTSLVHVLCNVLFVFLIAKMLFRDNTKVAYLAPLLLIISNHHIYMSFTSIPNSFATIFLFQLLYSLTILKQKMHTSAIFLALLISLVLILSHTITSLFVSITFFILWSGSYLSKYVYSIKKSWNGFNFSILFVVSMLAWWSFVSGHIRSLATLIKWGFEVDSFVNTPKDISLETLSYISIYEQLFDNSGMFLFFSLSFIGCLYMISRKYGDSLKFSFAIASITPLLIGFFSLIFDRYTIIHRWWYFSQLMLSIPLAVTLLLFITKIKTNIRYFVMTTFIVIFTFVLIMNSVANYDNHMFSSHSSITFALTSSELQAVKTSSHIWDDIIKTDWYYADSQKYEYNIEAFDVEFYENNLSAIKGTSLLLIRNYINHKPFQLLSSIKILDYNLDAEVESLGFFNIYDNGLVNGYV